MISLGQQVAAVEVARRIIAGAIKQPKPSSSEARLLAEQLSAAAETLRQTEARKP